MNRLLRIAFALLIVMMSVTGNINAADYSLTPVPMKLTEKDGSFTFQKGFKVSGSGLSAEMSAEIQKFVDAVNLATPLSASVADNDASAAVKVSFSDSKTLGTEGYSLSVTPEAVTIEAPTPAGLYYAFQTLKKLMPANVMAGVKDEKVTDYSVPCLEITDRPRFSHRGFELDCARHYHSMEEIKRMLDIMAVYKMNRFHWHLTDDQGWRVEIEKYPRLIEVSSISPNAYWYDFENKYEYMLNRPYGEGLYYTKAQMREIVAYAKERHIEVFPEIEMPGHMVAAIAAYPEFSCFPEGDHTIWYRPGVSQDVLNVANPAVIEFCKDVLTEMAEVFPYELIHIGGDETPSTNWTKNPECIALMKANGWTEPYKLQSWFTKQMADHLATLGKRAVCWNEVVTKEGADLDLAKDANIVVYDWLGSGTSVADRLGLQAVWCHTSYYYLDYGCSNDPGEPRFMGGAIPLPNVYNANPFGGTADTDNHLGVQGNLWSEYVAEDPHVEYMALPRLIAIAETGWTPANKKNLDDFRRRITADTTLWNYNNYTYGRHYLVDDQQSSSKVMPDKGEYYRLVTRATNHERAGRCIELVRKGSPLISSKQAAEGRIWTNTQVANTDANADWQLWTFELDPEGSGLYAMVCKAMPEGSVNPEAHSTSTDAKWSYDNNVKNYNFILGEGAYYGKDGANYFYSVRSNLNSGYWLNAAVESNNHCVNCWVDPADGNGGIWTFMPLNAPAAEKEIYPEMLPLHEGMTYMFVNAGDKFPGEALAGVADAANLSYAPAGSAFTGWKVTSVTPREDNSYIVRLTNAYSQLNISGLGTAVTPPNSASFFPNAMGKPVTLNAKTSVDVEIRRCSESDPSLHLILVKDEALYPVPRESQSLAGLITAGSSVAGQTPGAVVGAHWLPVEATGYTIECTDGTNTLLTTYGLMDNRVNYDPKALCPQIANHELVEVSVKDDVITATYRRTGYTLTYNCFDQTGSLFAVETQQLGADGKGSAVIPEFEFYTYESSDIKNGQALALTDDETVAVNYSTTAVNGVAEVGEEITATADLTDGINVLIYDAHAERFGYRYARLSDNTVQGASDITSASPNYVWTLEANDKNYNIKNNASGLYVGPLVSGSQNPMTETPEPFALTYSRVRQWSIRGTTARLYWNGNSDLSLAGWSDPHPYRFFRFKAAPYFKVTVNEVNVDNGETLFTTTYTIPAGGSLQFAVRSYNGLYLTKVEGNDALDRITDNRTVTVSYSANSGIESPVTDGSNAPSAIYDLQGRRLKAITTPGIYIVNGEKLYVK